jgi:hypothetical protein
MIIMALLTSGPVGKVLILLKWWVTGINFSTVNKPSWTMLGSILAYAKIYGWRSNKTNKKFGRNRGYLRLG